MDVIRIGRKRSREASSAADQNNQTDLGKDVVVTAFEPDAGDRE
jgi:hypothetical protein